MSKRKSMTALRRAKIFDAAKGVCHLCGVTIKHGEKWEAEHVIALECGGTDDDANLRPAHVGCHKAKTATDHRDGAKIKRVHARHVGAHRPKGAIRSPGFAPSPKPGPRIPKIALLPRPMFQDSRP